MKTEEAIEIIRYLEALCKPHKKNLYIEDIDEVIELLKQGEKDKKALDRLGNMVIDSIARAPWIDKTKKEQNAFKEKYFPEPSKDFTEKVMKKIRKEG